MKELYKVQLLNVLHKNHFYYYLAILFASLLIAKSVGLMNYADDVKFLNALENSRFSEWIVWRYQNWSGRVSIESIMVLTIGYSWFWKLSIPLLQVLLSFSLARICMGRASTRATFLIMILLMTIPKEISSQAVFWITGHYNYLMPTAMAFYALSVAMLERRSKLESGLALLATCILGYHEQVAIVFLITCLVLVFTRKRRFDLLLFASASINGLILFSAPGNTNRMVVETWRWFPQFSDYALLDKVMLGTDKLYQLVNIQHNWPFFLLLGYLMLLFARHFNKEPLDQLALLIIASYLVVLAINNHTQPFSSSPLLSVYRGGLDPSSVASSHTYVCYLHLFTTFSSLFYMLLKLAMHYDGIIQAGGLILMALMSVVMVGFSPTVYASSWRVTYLAEVLFIASLCTLFAHTWKEIVQDLFTTCDFTSESK